MFCMDPPIPNPPAMPREPLKKWFVVFTGLSGTGKDTASMAVMQNSGTAYRAEICKFSQPMKVAIATLLDVPVDYLEDRNYRNKVIPQLGVTPLDLMVRSFDFLPSLHPDICTYRTEQYLESRLKAAKKFNHVVVFNDVRQQKEAELLVRLADAHQYDMLTIHIKRQGTQPLSSDIHCQAITDYLAYHSRRMFVVFNNWEISILESRVLRMLHAVSILP